MARPVQRAPRLRPDQYLADSITRVGRFAKVDPRKGRKLPSLVKVIGVLSWLGLTVEAFRRARAMGAGQDAGGNETVRTAAEDASAAPGAGVAPVSDPAAVEPRDR